MNRPVKMIWDGETFRPASAFWAKLADEQFVVGAAHMVEEQAERSKASHDHFFAQVTEVWKNLPDHLAAEFPTADRLRKRALILAGFRDERSIVCSSKVEAQRVAAFLRPADEDAVVSVHGCAVVELKAKSQSYKAMGREVFQQSKDAVLAILSEMIGVDASSLERAAEMAA